MLYRTIKDGKPHIEHRNVTFDVTFDVIVVGIGTAGSVAAIRAGEQGVRVLAVDKATISGGVPVASGVWSYYFGTIAGKAAEVNNDAEKLTHEHGYAEYAKDAAETNICIPSAPKCIAIEQALRQANCHVWLESIVTGVYTQDKIVVGLQILHAGRLADVGCKCVIDAADGTVCNMAGCLCETGRRSDGKTMRFSKCIGKAVGEKVRPVWANFGYLDHLSPCEYTRQILNAACAPPCLLDEYGPNESVIFEGSIICRREVRNVITKKTLNLENCFSVEPSSKPVYFTFSHLDNSDSDLELENEAVQDWLLLINPHTYGVSVGIDMDCLITKEFDNLFLAGKHIGVGHDCVGFIRMKGDVEKSGEATAYMAVMYVNNGVISYEKLKQQLMQVGVLNPKHDLGIASVNDIDSTGIYRKAQLPCSAVELNKVLSSQSPELALLSVKIHANKEIAAFLEKNLESSDKILRHNSAIALGLIGIKSCTAVLREIISAPAYVLEHHDYKPEHYSWFNDTYHCNMVKAICLLGRFKDKKSADVIQRIYDNHAIDVTKVLKDDIKNRFKQQIVAFAKEFLNKLKE